MTTPTMKPMSVRKARAEVKRLRAELDRLHPMNLGRGLSSDEAEVRQYLSRDLARVLPFSGEPSPAIDISFV